ncbi:MAG: NnrU family protein [Kiloniellales bacterium]|nr:NnrU family protein [Kiloniellales bacterium]
MSETHNVLIATTLWFVGGHFLLSSLAVRRPLVEKLGLRIFRLLYSMVMLVAFIAMVEAYASAPFLPIWRPPEYFNWVPVVVMPFACFFLVAGLTTKGVTALGGEALAESPQAPAKGVYSITRHPFLWAVGLWALSHLLVRGDFSSIFMMGGLAFLAFFGMAHIDLRREVELGAAWGPTKLTTSRIPFAAILSGRCELDAKGIGVLRILGSVVLYIFLALVHSHFIGPPALPFSLGFAVMG